MRATDKRLDYPSWISWLLPILLLLLVTSRTHFLPLAGMPLAAFFFRKRLLDLILFLVLTTLSLIWLYVALHSTVDLRVERTYTTGYKVSYYVKKPLTFFTVFWSTLMNAELRQFYQMSFIGILGWLDVMFER
jgi:hypothetical protein